MSSQFWLFLQLRNFFHVGILYSMVLGILEGKSGSTSDYTVAV